MPSPGYLTASTFPDLMTRGKGKEEFGKTAMRHIEQLALDFLMVERGEEATADSLEWGLEHEDNARFFYQKSTLCSVAQPGFRVSPDFEYVGGTIDGLVGTEGGIEVKCPKNSIKHLFHFEELYTEYVYQVQGYLWIYNLKWIDFVSYDPRCPAVYQLKVLRVEPDTGIISALKARCEMAFIEAIKIVSTVTGEQPCSIKSRLLAA